MKRNWKDKGDRRLKEKHELWFPLCYYTLCTTLEPYEPRLARCHLDTLAARFDLEDFMILDMELKDGIESDLLRSMVADFKSGKHEEFISKAVENSKEKSR